MKKLWIISAAVCFLAIRASAREPDVLLKSYAIEMNHNKYFDPSADVAKNRVLTELELRNFNYQTRANFYVDFGYIPITGWEFSDEFDKISFLKDSILCTAYYDLDSKLVGTISNVSIADLPARALEKIDKNYKGYTIGDVVFFDDNELNESNMLYYDRRFDDEDKYFVELKNDQEKIVVQVNDSGDLSFFKAL
jgi:hypothetical protein